MQIPSLVEAYITLVPVIVRQIDFHLRLPGCIDRLSCVGVEAAPHPGDQRRAQQGGFWHRLHFQATSRDVCLDLHPMAVARPPTRCCDLADGRSDRKSTRLNSSHGSISYAVFCLKKKKNMT